MWTVRICGQESARADRQVAKVAIRADADKQPHSPMRIGTSFEVVRDQCRLLGRTDVQSPVRPCDLDSKMGPFADFEIDVGFVLARRFTAQAVEIIAGIGEILGRAVTSQLVAGAAVARSDIKSLASERPTLLVDAESDSDEAARVRGRVRKR